MIAYKVAYKHTKTYREVNVETVRETHTCQTFSPGTFTLCLSGLALLLAYGCAACESLLLLPGSVAVLVSGGNFGAGLPGRWFRDDGVPGLGTGEPLGVDLLE